MDPVEIKYICWLQEAGEWITSVVCSVGQPLWWTIQS